MLGTIASERCAFSILCALSVGFPLVSACQSPGYIMGAGDPELPSRGGAAGEGDQRSGLGATGNRATFGSDAQDATSMASNGQGATTNSTTGSRAVGGTSSSTSTRATSELIGSGGTDLSQRSDVLVTGGGTTSVTGSNRGSTNASGGNGLASASGDASAAGGDTVHGGATAIGGATNSQRSNGGSSGLGAGGTTSSELSRASSSASNSGGTFAASNPAASGGIPGNSAYCDAYSDLATLDSGSAHYTAVPTAASCFRFTVASSSDRFRGIQMSNCDERTVTINGVASGCIPGTNCSVAVDVARDGDGYWYVKFSAGTSSNCTSTWWWWSG